MGAKSGFALKTLQWFIRGIQFGCSAIILGIYSYFLATLNNHNLYISKTDRAVEGISGAGVVYTLAALLLLCCFAGIIFTSLIAIVFDVAFIGAFIYVAWSNRHGASSCQGYVDTPYGTGNSGQTTNAGSDGFTNLPSYHTACRLQTACLAVAIIAIFFFVFSILMELALIRHHRKEKRFGPSPANQYTSGYGRRAGFLNRFKRNRGGAVAAKNENALPEHTHPGQVDGRQSYATDNTAVPHDHHHHQHTTAAAGGVGYSPDHDKYETGYGYQQSGVDHTANVGDYGHNPPHHGLNHQGRQTYGDGVYDRGNELP